MPPLAKWPSVGWDPQRCTSLLALAQGLASPRAAACHRGPTLEKQVAHQHKCFGGGEGGTHEQIKKICPAVCWQ
eukprot:15471436-Alexandrium_andersonii.AAC.1